MKKKHSGEFVEFFGRLQHRAKPNRDLHILWTGQIEQAMRAAGTWPQATTTDFARVVAEYLSRLQACYWETVKHLCVAGQLCVDPERRMETFPAFQTLRLLHNRFHDFGRQSQLFYVWRWNGYNSPAITAVDISGQNFLITVRPFRPGIVFHTTPYTQLHELHALASVA